MFNVEEPCENVHSQSRRMIMVSPEPNYWIHACFEVAKNPRPSVTKSKGNEKGKGKGKENTTRQDVTYDYHDSSLQDFSLRSHILRGYEIFKLTHGSFTAILSNLGQQALELQIERFFTVWAWKWDVEEHLDFNSHLGVPIHPFSRVLTPILDDLAPHIPEDTCAFALMPPYVIPSNGFYLLRYPPSLVQHIISRIPPPSPPTAPVASSSDAAESTTTSQPSSGDGRFNEQADGEKQTDTAVAGTASTFLSMPSMNLGMDMRSLKWSWPGFSFGKASSLAKSPSTVPAPSPSIGSATAVQEQTIKGGDQPTEKGEDDVAKDSNNGVDAESLREAIETDYIATPSTRTISLASSSAPLDPQCAQPGVTPPISSHPSPLLSAAPAQESVPTIMELTSTREGVAVETSQIATEISIVSETTSDRPASVSESQKPVPTFLSTVVLSSDPTDPTNTQKKRVWHLTRDQLTFALITTYDRPIESSSLAGKAYDILGDMQSAITEQGKKTAAEVSLPSATKILQPQDKHIISTGGYTIASDSGFTSRSEHLFYGQQLLQSDLDVLEVFSRGQNPQHWHVAQRGLSQSGNGLMAESEVYMQVARKETTLTDVDNALGAVIRKFVN
ncbi:hypothetical protein AcW1_006762 [Taiwanofungus camphoratus]|nr:hypothetical protein AcV5_009351 [Antrodia cinnamomea]KAI0924734.1 hypothetical protein AcW2_005528 [Antrodia cinnamomea]KAI0953905.1 hypothetical protein AcV7_007304 [Antrodia cinnamomea]KAI0955070.1 hypothetical protein AcW1_006762 [Antrodia cinnamomea]